MSKFCWEENELVITESLCELCEFNKSECKDCCEKYESKPKEVLENTIKCPFFSRKRKIKL